jgi:hypothetical protein
VSFVGGWTKAGSLCQSFCQFVLIGGIDWKNLFFFHTTNFLCGGFDRVDEVEVEIHFAS